MSINGKPLLIAGALGKAAGSIVTFPDGNGGPFRKLAVGIEPVQDLHGYDNPWPAGGGKNLFDKAAVEASKYLDTVTGLPVSASYAYCVSDYIAVKSGISVFIPASQTARRWFYDISKTPTTYLNNPNNQVFTPTEDGYIRVSIKTDVVSLDTYQIEIGSTATPYAPYSNICPISGWTAVDLFRESAYDPTATPYIPITIPSEAGTVYGGYIHVAEDGSAKLVVDRAYKLLTKDDTFQIGTSNTFNRITCSFYQSVGKTSGSFVCDSCVTMPNTSGGYGSAAWQIWGSKSAPRCWISVPTTISTVADFETYLETNPIGIVYELATPVTYQLSDIQVQTLLGQNTMWADTGPVDVEYTKRSLMYMS